MPPLGQLLRARSRRSSPPFPLRSRAHRRAPTAALNSLMERWRSLLAALANVLRVQWTSHRDLLTMKKAARRSERPVNCREIRMERSNSFSDSDPEEKEIKSNSSGQFTNANVYWIRNESWNVYWINDESWKQLLQLPWFADFTARLRFVTPTAKLSSCRSCRWSSTPKSHCCCPVSPQGGRRVGSGGRVLLVDALGIFGCCCCAWLLLQRTCNDKPRSVQGRAHTNQRFTTKTFSLGQRKEWMQRNCSTCMLCSVLKTNGLTFIGNLNWFSPRG